MLCHVWVASSPRTLRSDRRRQYPNEDADSPSSAHFRELAGGPGKVDESMGNVILGAATLEVECVVDELTMLSPGEK